MELLTFRKFTDLALAQNLAALLDEHDIEYLLEKSPEVFNPTFGVRNELSTEYSVKINAVDFSKVTQLLADYESQFVEEVEPDYYLFDFTTPELMEIITKPDEWSAFDFELAKKILANRGTVIDESAIQHLGEKRLAELKAPERSEATWVSLGYAFAVLGGVLGFFIGWQLWKSKKTLPNGEQIYTYSESNRKDGTQIFYLSVLGLILAIIYKLGILK